MSQLAKAATGAGAAAGGILLLTLCLGAGLVSKPIGLYVDSWSFRNSHQRHMSQTDELMTLLDEHAAIQVDIVRLGPTTPQGRALTAQQSVIADRIRRAAANTPRAELPPGALRFLGERQ